MDDLAVDSDEEVDYSKMDQVTTFPSMQLFSELQSHWYGFSALGQQEGSSGPLGLRHSGGVFRLYEQQGGSPQVS